MDVKKYGATGILAVMMVGVIGSAGTIILRNAIGVSTLKAGMKERVTNELSIVKKINDIHWYLIKRNKIIVPEESSR